MQDEAQDGPCVLCRTMQCHAMLCNAMAHSGMCPLHGTHVPRTLGSAIDTSSAGARSPPEHPPGSSNLHSLVPIWRRGPGRILLMGPCIMHCLFVSTFPVCNSIRQTVVLLIQWCLIFDFLKYHKWMGQRMSDPLYMSSNTYLNI